MRGADDVRFSGPKSDSVCLDLLITCGQIFANLGMNYAPACERIVDNGEPGFAWLDNMRQYSRMGEGADNKVRTPCPVVVVWSFRSAQLTVLGLLVFFSSSLHLG